jgi:hypothetical protein
VARLTCSSGFAKLNVTKVGLPVKNAFLAVEYATDMGSGAVEAVVSINRSQTLVYLTILPLPNPKFPFLGIKPGSKIEMKPVGKPDC